MAADSLISLVAKVLARPDIPSPLVSALADLLKLNVEFNERFLRLKDTAGSDEALEPALEAGEDVYRRISHAIAQLEERGRYTLLEQDVRRANDDYCRINQTLPKP